MKKQSVIILLLAFIHVPFAFSTEYYFSNFGNDELNTGTSEASPFKTITKLNTLTLKPGDKVFFKRGESFQGQITLKNSGSSSSYINFNAYGSGNNPVINGSIKVAGWKIHSGNVYVADLPGTTEPITQLFANGSLMTLARYPNKGFLLIDSSFGNKSVTSNALNQRNDYWAGATLIARTERWVYENRQVSASIGGTLLLTKATQYSFKKGHGFYLSNKLSEVDMPGEWYHDVQAQKIYFIPPTSEDPTNLNIEASVYNYGIEIEKQSYISIYNFAFSNQRLDGVLANGCSQTSIGYSTFSKIYRNGIWTGNGGGNNIRIIYNQFSDIGNNGIDVNGSSLCTIQWNKLKNIAMIPGGGTPGDGEYIGIMGGKNSYIGYNTLDHIGYNGIHGQSGDTIAYNYITYTCLTKDDGAGIYFYKSDHLVVENNIVLNSIGNGDATSKEYSAFAHGIYLDDSSSYCKIYNNTIVNGEYGIFVHNSFNNTIQKNTLYNNRKSQLNLQNDHKIGKDFKENVIIENIFYSLHPDQYNLTLWNYRSSIQELGSFDKNLYCNPYSDILIKSRNIPDAPAGTVPKNQTFTFNSWKTASGYDANSRLLQKQLGNYYNVTVNTQNLIPNPTFIKNKNDWYSWGSSGYSIQLDSSNGAMSDNALKSGFPSSGLNQSGNFASGNFIITKDKYYLLSFKASSLKNSNLDFDLSQNAYPYKTADLNKSFLITNEAKNLIYIFKSNFSYENTRVLFSTTGYDSTLWIDDISIVEIAVDTNATTPAQKSPIFINNTLQTQRFNLSGSYTDLNGTRIRRSINVAPFSSKILITSLSSVTTPYRTILNEDQTDIQMVTIFNIPAEQGESIYIQYPARKEALNVTYSFKDMTGKEVLRGSYRSIGSDLIEIPTNNLGRGLFILTLQSGSETHNAKIIIQ